MSTLSKIKQRIVLKIPKLVPMTGSTRVTLPCHLLYSDVVCRPTHGCTSATETTLCQITQVPRALEFSKCTEDARPLCRVESWLDIETYKYQIFPFPKTLFHVSLNRHQSVDSTFLRRETILIYIIGFTSLCKIVHLFEVFSKCFLVPCLPFSMLGGRDGTDSDGVRFPVLLLKIQLGEDFA